MRRTKKGILLNHRQITLFEKWGFRAAKDALMYIDQFEEGLDVESHKFGDHVFIIHEQCRARFRKYWNQELVYHDIYTDQAKKISISKNTLRHWYSSIINLMEQESAFEQSAGMFAVKEPGFGYLMGYFYYGKKIVEMPIPKSLQQFAEASAKDWGVYGEYIPLIEKHDPLPANLSTLRNFMESS